MVTFGKIVKYKFELKSFLKYGTKMLKSNSPSIVYLRESPYFNGHLEYFKKTEFHYAMSYRSDADIYFPYGMILSKENESLPMGQWKPFDGQQNMYANFNHRPKVRYFI